MNPEVTDLHELPWEERVKIIGRHATREPGEMIGFFVDNDAKADQYIAKLKQDFPSVSVVWRGPLQGVAFVKIAVVQ